MKTERALELSARELSARQNLEAHDARALALWRAGRLDEAEQAIERAGTKAGNKGEEATLAVIETVNLLRRLD